MSDFNQNKITLTLLIIFALILGVLIWFKKTDYSKTSEYVLANQMEIKSTILEKIDEHPIKSNKVNLNSGRQLIIKRAIFDLLEVGDSVVKKPNCDSIYFYSASGLIINDYNKFLRVKYLKTN